LDRTSPTASITSPTDGVSLSGDQITIVADAFDSLSGVGAVQFFVGYNEVVGANDQSMIQPPTPASTENPGMMIASDITSQAYWHEVGWDGDGSDGWSFNWTPTGVPDQSGISLFIYVYDRAGNYQGAMRSDLTLYRNPVNDEINSAIQINTPSYANLQYIYNATSAIDDPALTKCNRAPGQATVWYKYVPSENGQINLNTIGSDYDTMLAVWTGTRGSLSLVSCNDDRVSDLQSELMVRVVAGTTYYIEVAKFAGYLVTSLDIRPQDKIGENNELGILSGGMLIFNFEFTTPFYIFLPLVIKN
jgi:hypothetical protein